MWYKVEEDYYVYILCLDSVWSMGVCVLSPSSSSCHCPSAAMHAGIITQVAFHDDNDEATMN